MDDMMIYMQTYQGMDEADSHNQQLSITNLFQNLNLVNENEHDMMDKENLGTCYQHGIATVTEEPHNKIPHISLVSKHPDPRFGVPVTLQEDVQMKWQTPNNKTHLDGHIEQDMIPNQLETAILHWTREVPSIVQGRNPKVIIGYRVPMTTGTEKYIWEKFLKLAETHKWSERQGVWNPRDQVKVDRRHPFVRYLASFAVHTYNAVCMKAGVSWGIVMTSVLEFKYIKVSGIYANYIKLVAIDNGVRCVCEALVQTLPSDGSKTLIRFSIPSIYKSSALEFVAAAGAEDKKREGAAEKSELLKQGQNDRKGKKKANVFDFLPDMIKKSKEVSAWEEMRKERVKALKVSPSGSGLSRCYFIGSYSYKIPLKEFKNVKY